jgi:hypothetical protein
VTCLQDISEHAEIGSQSFLKKKWI